MKMERLRKKFEDKNISAEIIKFIELCLMEKESVEVEKEGKMVEDPERSRLSWEDVYLHPLFKGEFNHIVREVVGSNILLTIKTYATANEVDIVKILEDYEKQQKSDVITVDNFGQILVKNKINIPEKDINRLDRLFGEKG